jgi:hypothetical protein
MLAVALTVLLSELFWVEAQDVYSTPVQPVGADTVSVAPSGSGSVPLKPDPVRTPPKDSLEQTIAGDPLALALHSAEKGLFLVRSAKVGERLGRLRELDERLRELRRLLGVPGQYTRATMAIPRDGCIDPVASKCLQGGISPEETLARQKEYVASHPLLQAGADRPQLRVDVLRAHEALTAFFSDKFIRTPAPDTCDFADHAAPYTWDVEPIQQALGDLRSIPDTLLAELQTTLREAVGTDNEGILSLLPGATCEKMAQIVCHRLRGARKSQRQASDSGSLRTRAKSLVAAQPDLLKLKDRITELGCTQQEFGLDDSVAYARALISEAQAQFDEDGRAFASQLASILSQEGETTGWSGKSTQDLLRVQRLELAALALGVATPAISYLNAYMVPLNPTEGAWKHASEDLARLAADSSPPGPMGSGLRELERLVGLLLLRRDEACAFIRSPYARGAHQQSSGLLFERARELTDSLVKHCEQGASG